MKKNERISSINSVLRDYFAKHPQSGMILAKEFMPLFIKNGIFNKDNREGLPIRKVLRDLDTENSLDKIPYVHTERKPKTINWYFRPLLLSLVIFMGMLSSCSFKSNTDFPEVTHVAFQKEKHGKWGMVGVNGNILFEMECLEFRIMIQINIFTIPQLQLLN